MQIRVYRDVIESSQTEPFDASNYYTKAEIDAMCEECKAAVGFDPIELPTNDKPTQPGESGMLYHQPNGILWYWSETDQDYKQINGLTDLSNYYNKQQIEDRFMDAAEVGYLLDDLSTNIQSQIGNIVTYQKPVRFDYNNSNTFTLPKTISDVAEVRLYNPNNSYSFLQDNEYTYSGQTVTVDASLSTGMAVKIFYFA